MTRDEFIIAVRLKFGQEISSIKSFKILDGNIFSIKEVRKKNIIASGWEKIGNKYIINFFKFDYNYLIENIISIYDKV